jgi:hypothetical protein
MDGGNMGGGNMGGWNERGGNMDGEIKICTYIVCILYSS